ncbi:helix-turn-helix transcriptional regulator [Yunchengibacter salinarum]|uniref:helix-turn-helix transcriptional regulator n=1 Tax=Yunchengibacter salinarum TaxID=3133399 RepID=UPI0035B5CE96
MRLDSIVPAEEVLGVTEALLDCPSLEDASDRLARPVGDFVGARSAALFQFRWDNGLPRVGFSSCFGVDPTYHALYNDHYFRHDPLVHSAMLRSGRQPGTRPEVGLFCLADISDYDRLMKTDYYNDFFRPISVHHVLAISVPTGRPEESLVMGLHRPADAKPFDAEDMARARAVSRTVMTKFQALLRDVQLAEKTAIIDILAETRGGRAVLAIDSKGMILYRNRIEGSRPFSDLQAGTALPDSLMALVRPAMRQLDREGQPPGGKPLAVTTGEGLGLAVSLRHISGGGMARRYVLTLERESRPDMESRAAALGLTRRESVIARAVAEGYSNGAIANLYSISVRTVENHLRAIYAKCGASSRTRLTHMLLNDAGETP